MEKIIFFSLVIPILGFVLYLGASAIMKGFDAKKENKEKNIDEQNNLEDNSQNQNNISSEINKLNELLKDGVINQEEFEKEKKKILDK